MRELYQTGVYPGIAFSLRRRGREIINRAIGHSHGAGPGDATHAEQRLMRPDTPVCLFSASKAVTAMLAHWLHQEGQINIHDPVSHYIPEFGRYGKAEVSIEHVLSHRSGVATIPKNTPPELLDDHEAIMELLCDMHPVGHHLGTSAYHAVTGGFIVRELVLRVTGKDIDKLLHHVLRKPLGMRYFTYGASARVQPDVATNYFTGMPLLPPLSGLVEKALGGSMQQVMEVSNQPLFLNAIIPAGNIVATASELSLFYQLLLDERRGKGPGIFHPGTIEQATSPVDKVRLDGTLKFPLKFSAGMMMGDAPIGLYGPGTGQAYGHIGLTNKIGWADPKRDIAVSILTTGNPVLGLHFGKLYKFFHTIAALCDLN